MKLPFPRRIKAWLVALVSLTAVAVVSIAPMMRPRAQSQPPGYDILDLGTFGGTESKAFAINSCGQIAGYATLPGGTKRPFFRPSNSLIDLGVLSGDGIATSVNNSGYVVGNSPFGVETDRAFIWHDDNGDGDSDAGEMKQLLPNGAVGAAEDINDNGKVVGWILSDGGSGGTGGFQGFIWENNNFQLISGSPAHNDPRARGINNAGTIVGDDSNLLRGFILRNGIFTDIPAFGTGDKSVAYAVSESDHVVGTAKVSLGASAPEHAFLWTDAGPTPGLKDLGTLAGKTHSEAYNVAIVNGSVQVVGTSYNLSSDAQAFVWQDLDADGITDPNEMKDLLSLVPLPDRSDWTRLSEARSINSSGQIVGFGVKAIGGETHAFLLTPTGVSPSPCLPTVSVSVSPSAVNEDGLDSLTYTFTRSITTGSALTVNFSTTGTADSSDYGISHSESVTIQPNQQSATVVVDPTIDSTFEPNDTVVVTTTTGPGYNVGSATSATGTINNDDVLNVSVVVAPASANEDGGTDLVYTFTRNSTIGSLTVNFSVGGTADPNTDYSQTGATSFTPPTGTVTFLNGNSTATVTINPSTDSAVEPDETIVLTVTSGSGYTVGSPSSATGTITNDDTAVTVNLSPLSVTESDTPNLVYTFTRSGVTTGVLTVNFSVAGTATLNTDYTQSGAATFGSSAGTVTLPAGSSFATVTLDPTPDFIHEGDETATLTVTTGAGYNVGSPSSQQGTITDDDATPTIQISNVTGPEPPSGSTTFAFTVSLTHPSSSQITVNYATDTTGATATGGANCGGGTDFVNIPSTGLTFAAGETSKVVHVVVCSDNDLEPDETFFVNLSGNSANSNLPGGTRGTGTITPQAPVLWTEVAGPSCPSGTCLAAVDSVTFARGPFRVTNDLNFSSDHLTRIILFTSNLGMTNANLPSGILSIHVAGYGEIPKANIEHVGTVAGVSGMDASYIIVKLPANLPAGSSNLTVKMGSAESNAAILSIIP